MIIFNLQFDSIQCLIECIFFYLKHTNWIKITFILRNWLEQAPEALSLMINPPAATSRFCIFIFANVNLIRCKSIIFCTENNLLGDNKNHLKHKKLHERKFTNYVGTIIIRIIVWKCLWRVKHKDSSFCSRPQEAIFFPNNTLIAFV